MTSGSRPATADETTRSEASYVPPNGFVPTAKVATDIATAVLVPIYGSEQIRRELPLTAVLTGDHWVVEGSIAAGALGGVARIEIAKADGRVLRVVHGR